MQVYLHIISGKRIENKSVFQFLGGVWAVFMIFLYCLMTCTDIMLLHLNVSLVILLHLVWSYMEIGKISFSEYVTLM